MSKEAYFDGEISSKSGICEKCLYFWHSRHSYLVPGSPWDDQGPYHWEGSFKHHGDSRQLWQSALAGCHMCSLAWRSGQFSGLESDHDLAQQHYGLRMHWFQDQYGISIVLEPSEQSLQTRTCYFGINIARPDHFGARSDSMSLTEYPTTTSSGSAETFDFVRSALRECQSTHVDCNKLRSTNFIRPRRLLKISKLGDYYGVRLCDGDDPVSMSEGYITLSHCWGHSPTFRLLETSLADFATGIPYEQLPKTFQHAVHVVSQLGYHYLWIDSLCIVQDGVDDWRRESARMRDIYRNSAFTIAAVASKNDNEGLFTRRPPLAFQPLEFECGFLPVVASLDPNQYNWSSENVSEWRHKALMDRGWTLQEHLLSRTIVAYTSDSVHVLCPEYSTGEFYQHRNDDLQTSLIDILAAFTRLTLKNLRLDREDDNISGEDDQQSLTGKAEHQPIVDHEAEDVWIAIVENYSQRKLTYPTDKWTAISGIAADLLSAHNFQMVAGHSVRSLAASLYWRARAPEQSTRVKTLSPSWSWVSCDTPVDFYRYNSRGPKPTLTVDSFHGSCDPHFDWSAASTPGEKVADVCSINISAYVCPINITNGEAAFVRPLSRLQGSRTGFNRLYWDREPEDQDETLGLIHSFYLVTGAPFVYVILVKRSMLASGDSSTRPVFSRCGTTVIWYEHVESPLESFGNDDLAEVGERMAITLI